MNSATLWQACVSRLPFLPPPLQKEVLGALHPIIADVDTPLSCTLYEHRLRGNFNPPEDVWERLISNKGYLDYLRFRSSAALETARAILKIDPSKAENDFFKPADRHLRGVLFRDIAKVSQLIWNAKTEAREGIRHMWLEDQDRPGSGLEIQVPSSNEKKTSALIQHLSERGYAAKVCIIPEPLDAEDNEVQWIAGQKVANPIPINIIKSILDPSLPSSSTYQFPRIYFLGKEISGDESALRKMIMNIFGSPIPLAWFLRSLVTTQGDLWTYKIEIHEHSYGFQITGDLKNKEGCLAGYFSRIIKKTPAPGIPWVLLPNGVRIYEQRINSGQNFSQKHYQEMLAFSFLIGIDSVELRADEVGCYLWPKLGFDFSDAQMRARILNEFSDFLFGRDIHIDVSHFSASDIAHFKSEGIKLGKEFLLNLNKRLPGEKAIPMHFKSGDPTWPGWKHLYAAC